MRERARIQQREERDKRGEEIFALGVRGAGFKAVLSAQGTFTYCTARNLRA